MNHPTRFSHELRVTHHVCIDHVRQSVSSKESGLIRTHTTRRRKRRVSDAGKLHLTKAGGITIDALVSEHRETWVRLP